MDIIPALRELHVSTIAPGSLVLTGSLFGIVVTSENDPKKRHQLVEYSDANGFVYRPISGSFPGEPSREQMAVLLEDSIVEPDISAGFDMSEPDRGARELFLSETSAYFVVSIHAAEWRMLDLRTGLLQGPVFQRMPSCKWRFCVRNANGEWVPISK